MTRSAIGKNLVPFVEPYWERIMVAAARSLKRKPAGFLPADPSRKNALGCGVWGCAWQTADPRFVVKASLDATEGPHVAIAMKHLRKHPGVAYYHALWQLPEMVWTPQNGYTPVWIMVREEADVDSTYSGTKPAHGLKKVYDILESLPSCCDCLSTSISWEWQRRHGADDARTCAADDRQKDEVELRKLLKKLDGTPGECVGGLIRDAYFKHRILLGDVHYDNVGFRRHDLTDFGVARHKKLIVTDLGDQGQAALTRDQYPKIGALKNPVEVGAITNSIPRLP